MDKLVIIGAGGFGREVSWLVEEINRDSLAKGLPAKWNLVGFADEDQGKWGAQEEGYPVFPLNYIKKYHDQLFLVIAIADPAAKQKMAMRFAAYNFPALVHPQALVAKTAAIGKGCILQAGVVISTDTVVGDFSIINLHCTVGHDASIGEYSTLHVAVDIAGYAEVGKGCVLGTKTAVIPGKKLADYVVTGAGTVVINDLPMGCTAVGVPARIVKRQEEKG